MLFFGRKKSSAFKAKSQQFSVLVVSAMVLFFSFDLRDSQAAFELNFDPDKTNGHSYTSFGNCENYSINMSHFSNNVCSGFGAIGGSHDDGTAAFQRVFTNGGKTYYHVIIGDYLAGDTFLLEYYIEAVSGTTYRGSGPRNASAYTNTADMTCSNSNSDCLYNMANPYGADSGLGGTGTGNPTRVIMRQVLDDGITYSEFLKGAGDANSDGLYDDSSAYFDKKPLISQKINEAGVISAEYSLDMRSKTYSDTTPVSETEKVNQTFILQGPTAANQGDYDSTGATQTPTNMADSTGVVVDGGAYKYTNGTSFGGSYGDYTYYLSDGVTENGNQTQPYDRDYSVFCVETQNVDWSGNGACVNGNGGGSGRRGRGGWGGW